MDERLPYAAAVGDVEDDGIADADMPIDRIEHHPQLILALTRGNIHRIDGERTLETRRQIVEVLSASLARHQYKEHIRQKEARGRLGHEWRGAFLLTVAVGRSTIGLIRPRIAEK